MKLIKKIVVTASLLSCLISTKASASDIIEVRCRIESSGFLTDQEMDQYSQTYRLSAPATQEGGRHLLWENTRFELWVKTDAYVQSQSAFRVSAFSTVLLDKHRKLMSEATSSVSESPRRAILTLHNLHEDLSEIKDRLIVTCVENI